jgi:single-strand DNA-binding protein
MSNSINRVYLLGHLGAAPELRSTPTASVLRLRLATNESWIDREKKLQERTDWHDVVLFGARAEGLARLLQKGDALLVEGNLRTSSYEKDGATRWRTEVVARDVCLTSRRRASPSPEAPSDDPFGVDALVAGFAAEGEIPATSPVEPVATSVPVAPPAEPEPRRAARGSRARLDEAHA